MVWQAKIRYYTDGAVVPNITVQDDPSLVRMLNYSIFIPAAPPISNKGAVSVIVGTGKELDSAFSNAFD